MAPKYKFSYLPEFFVDLTEVAKNSPNAQVTRQPQLGILDRAYDGVGPTSAPPQLSQWAKFANYVGYLNEKSGANESYKVFFLIRHGTGVHNVVMRDVGSEAWRDHWSRLDGNGKLNWADAHLVDAGIAQAKELAQFWVDAAGNDGMPVPQSLYTSPLARCLETTRLAYTPVLEAQGRELRPVVKEALREYLTVHTCDRRSSRSWIQEHYPRYIIEDGFAEDDPVWDPEVPETMEHHVERKHALLEDIFDHDQAQFVSLTTHSYAVSAILKAVGAPLFRVSECSMVPLFIKAEKL